MDLPPEIRIIIYRLVVVQGVNFQGVPTCFMLVPPAIAKVSKQIRTEVLPIFYGVNSFDIDMDIDIVEYDEYEEPIVQDDNTKLEDFLRMCSCMADTGGLRFIKSLNLRYSEPVWEDMSNYLFGFGIGDNKEKSERNRVGNSDLDWSDEDEVKKAVIACLEKAVDKHRRQELTAHVPVLEIIQVLSTLAKDCHSANHYVELWWDYGH